eukprot:g28875.t1
MMVWAVHTTFCRFLWSWAEQLPYQAVMHLDNMLDNIEVGEGPDGHAKFPEPPEEEEASLCLLDCRIYMERPGQVVGYRHSEELDDLHSFNLNFVDVQKVAFVQNLASQSWVYREYNRGLRADAQEAPVLSVIVEEVQLPILTDCG